jgi:Two component regulator propeller
MRYWAGASMCVVAVLVGALATASTSRIWVCDSEEDYAKGEARGVAVSSEGELLLSLSTARIPGISEPFIFSSVEGPDGTIYLGTGDGGHVVRIPNGGQAEVEATLPEKEVTALALGRDGTLYAGTSPSGKVYRISGGRFTAVFDPRAVYVWALAVGKHGTLYVGTGEPGMVFAVRGEQKAEPLFNPEDAHVRSLLVDGRGRLWVGTSGKGIVFRVDPGGKAEAVYDSSRTEIDAMTTDGAGRVWVAAVSAETGGGRPSHRVSPPTAAPRQAHPGSAESPQEPGEGPAEQEPHVTVSVSMSAISARPPKGTAASDVVEIDRDDLATVVWTSSEDLAYDVRYDPQRKGVLVATGPHGRLYFLQGRVASLERTFDERAVTAITASALMTNSPAVAYRRGPADEGAYVSPVKDTSRPSRFGAFRWIGADSGGRVSFSFRSGNSALPDTTWSRWSEPLRASSDAQAEILAPAGRFLQWKVEMQKGPGGSPVVRRVEAAYRNQNTAPVIENLAVLPPTEVLARGGGGATGEIETSPDDQGIFTTLEEARGEAAPRKLHRKGYRTLVWKGADPDDDPLLYSLWFRPEGAKSWLRMTGDTRESFYSFDSTALPDGWYRFRVEASDREANPGDPRAGSRISDPVLIDNTPPEISIDMRKAGILRVTVSDAGSPIRKLEFSVNAGPLKKVDPDDGISDSPRESYTIRLGPQDRGAYLLIRATDAAFNVAAKSVVAP